VPMFVDCNPRHRSRKVIYRHRTPSPRPASRRSICAFYRQFAAVGWSPSAIMWARLVYSGGRCSDSCGKGGGRPAPYSDRSSGALGVAPRCSFKILSHPRLCCARD
jgi:hypothetical protein